MVDNPVDVHSILLLVIDRTEFEQHRSEVGAYRWTEEPVIVIHHVNVLATIRPIL